MGLGGWEMNEQPLSTNTYIEQVSEERTFTENKPKSTATPKERAAMEFLKAKKAQETEHCSQRE